MTFVRIQSNYTATSVSDLFHFVGETERVPFGDWVADRVPPELCVDFALNPHFAPNHHESDLTFSHTAPSPETSRPRCYELQQPSRMNGRMSS